MTKELLEQYPDICAEIRELEEQLHRGVSDTVSGNAEDPYTQRPVYNTPGAPLDLAARRDRLNTQKTEIEAFVDGLPNSKIRRIVTYRALKGYDWKTVAARMGSGYSEATVKKRYYRVF